jgi:hypothetical protein
MSLVPATAGFAPVTAAHFRVVIASTPPAVNPGFMPVAGADTGPFAAMAKPKNLRLSQLMLSAERRSTSSRPRPALRRWATTTRSMPASTRTKPAWRLPPSST